MHLKYCGDHRKKSFSMKYFYLIQYNITLAYKYRYKADNYD